MMESGQRLDKGPARLRGLGTLDLTLNDDNPTMTVALLTARVATRLLWQGPCLSVPRSRRPVIPAKAVITGLLAYYRSLACRAGLTNRGVDVA